MAQEGAGVGGESSWSEGRRQPESAGGGIMPVGIQNVHVIGSSWSAEFFLQRQPSSFKLIFPPAYRKFECKEGDLLCWLASDLLQSEWKQQ
jgi:hypothetical protein